LGVGTSCGCACPAARNRFLFLCRSLVIRQALQSAHIAGSRNLSKLSFADLNCNPFHLIEVHLVAPAIVELRRARRSVVRHGGGVFERAAVLEVRRNPRCRKV
jgi:hypothetical protein